MGMLMLCIGIGGGYTPSAAAVPQSSAWSPPSAPAGSAQGANVSASGMQGFGNPNFSEATTEKSWYQVRNNFYYTYFQSNL